MKTIKTIIKFLFTSLFVIVFGIIVCFLGSKIIFHEDLIASFLVSGRSMNPTINDGDFLIGYKAFDIERGDIVVIDNENNFLFDNDSSCGKVIKRCAGVPGDTIEAIDGIVYVNGERYAYVSDNLSSQLIVNFKIDLEDGEYFVIGDNYENSFDSRLWENQKVPFENIKYEIIKRKEV